MVYQASNNNLRMVQRQLGHSRITTTQIYADVLPELMIENMSAMEKMANRYRKGRKKNGVAVAASLIER